MSRVRDGFYHSHPTFVILSHPSIYPSNHPSIDSSILSVVSIIDNEYGCELAEGGYLSMVAMGLYYACLIILCCLSSTPDSPLLVEKNDDNNTNNNDDDDDTTVRTRDHPHRHDWDDMRSTGGASQRSRSRSVHFWDE